MEMNHKIKIYPVENADNSFIKTSDNMTIQIDCQIRNSEDDSNEIKILDVKKDILENLEKDADDNPTLDLFVLSHPHKDHCLGFEDNYYCGDPDNYNKENRENEEIIIGELWVTKAIFGNDISDQATAIRREAKRRRKLVDENSSLADKTGNRIHIIGYNDNDRALEGLHYIPGQIVDTINGKHSDLIEFFIHAPFKSDLVKGKADKDHNTTSIVFQISFRTIVGGEIKSRAIFGGDADHYIWEKVLRKSEEKGRTDRLKWDLFLSPHHCSWSFFNDRPYDENKDPKEYSLQFLDYGNKNAYIVASSKKILDNDQNPPHYQAKTEYAKKVGEAFFRNTALHKGEKEPKPLEFEIHDNGLILKKGVSEASISITDNKIHRAG
jgi:hypothetical protein